MEELVAWCEQHRRTRDRGLIVTYSPDRFARLGTRLVGFYEERLHRAGWDLRYVDLERTGNALVDGVSGSLRAELAAEESRIKRDRALTGMPGRAKLGLWQGGPAPFGYDVTDGKLVSNGDAKTVRAMFTDAADTSVSLKALAAKYGMGYTTFLWRLDDRKGAYVYRGALVWGVRGPGGAERVESPRAHEAIVDRATFESVQRRFGSGEGRHVPHARGAAYALSGLIQCERGHALTGSGGERQEHEGRGYRRLYCRACSVGQRNDAMEATAAKLLAAHATKAAKSPALKAAVKEALAAESGSGTAAARDAERRDVEAQRTRLVEAIATGALTAQDAKPKMQALKAALARLDAAQDTEPDRPALRTQLEGAVKLLSDFGRLWDKATPQERRELFAAFVESATLDKAGKLTLDVVALPGIHAKSNAGLRLGS